MTIANPLGSNLHQVLPLQQQPATITTTTETGIADWKILGAMQSIKPPNGYAIRIAAPNWIQRILWRALGVTWKDLRPERDMDELRKLK